MKRHDYRYNKYIKKLVKIMNNFMQINMKS